AAEHAAAPFATATIFAMNAEPARRVPPALAADGAPIAAVIATAREPATSVAAPSARREINREIRVGDVSVELGEPMPPRPSIEHAGSLLASIPRPGWQPRRRL
ncbi:MAG TPA: hypothetical protein VIX73_38875, partial [Kofleriaceae bacterium]